MGGSTKDPNLRGSYRHDLGDYSTWKQVQDKQVTPFLNLEEKLVIYIRLYFRFIITNLNYILDICYKYKYYILIYHI